MLRTAEIASADQTSYLVRQARSETPLHKDPASGRLTCHPVLLKDSLLPMPADITAGVFALAGAILGSLGTIAAQWRAGVVERRRLEHETTGRVNALAISVFREFLAAAKVVERLAELREAGQAPSNDEIQAATHEMWLGCQEVSVFCPTPIHAPSLAFTKALQEVVRHKPGSAGVTGYLKKPRYDLFDVAGPIFREQGH